MKSDLDLIKEAFRNPLVWKMAAPIVALLIVALALAG